MVLIQETKRFEVASEQDAVEAIQHFKQQAYAEGYEVKKATYQKKQKTYKGEVVDVWFWVDVTLSYEAPDHTYNPPKKEDVSFR